MTSLRTGMHIQRHVIDLRDGPLPDLLSHCTHAARDCARKASGAVRASPDPARSGTQPGTAHAASRGAGRQGQAGGHILLRHAPERGRLRQLRQLGAASDPPPAATGPSPCGALAPRKRRRDKAKTILRLLLKPAGPRMAPDMHLAALPEAGSTRAGAALLRPCACDPPLCAPRAATDRRAQKPNLKGPGCRELRSPCPVYCAAHQATLAAIAIPRQAIRLP